MSEQKQESAQGTQSEPTRQNGEVPWWRNDPWMGAHLAAENRNKNAELALQYEGKYVAWFPDGSGIRDADDNSVVLVERIRASGDDPTWYTYEYLEQIGTRI